MLLDQVDFALGRKENETSLKYLFSRSGHTRRMLTTSSATSSSSAAVLRPSRKCSSVRFPPLRGGEGAQQGRRHAEPRVSAWPPQLHVRSVPSWRKAGRSHGLWGPHCGA